MGAGFKVRAAFMVVEGSGAKGIQLAQPVLEHLAWSSGEMVARVRSELLTRFPEMVQTVR
jgi:DNA primase